MLCVTELARAGNDSHFFRRRAGRKGWAANSFEAGGPAPRLEGRRHFFSATHRGQVRMRCAARRCGATRCEALP